MYTKYLLLFLFLFLFLCFCFVFIFVQNSCKGTHIIIHTNINNNYKEIEKCKHFNINESI